MQTITILGDVPSKKNRQRITTANDRIGIYKPAAVRDFEKRVSDALLVGQHRALSGPLQVSLTLIFGRHEPDLDGTITTVLDALQDAGLFENDKEVRRIYDCEKRPSASAKDDPPRVIVIIGSLS